MFFAHELRVSSFPIAAAAKILHAAAFLNETRPPRRQEQCSSSLVQICQRKAYARLDFDQTRYAWGHPRTQGSVDTPGLRSIVKINDAVSVADTRTKGTTNLRPLLLARDSCGDIHDRPKYSFALDIMEAPARV